MAEETGLEALFYEVFGGKPDACAPLRGDGSERRLCRLSDGARTAIGVRGSNAAENRAFLGFTRCFLAAGLPVPEIFAVSADELSYLEEDLGDTLLFDWQQERRNGAGMTPETMLMYARVLGDLVRFQIDAHTRVDYGLCYQYDEFGAENMRFDMRYFREMFLDQLYPDYDASAYERDCDALACALLESDRRYFLYRDFQSRNVMIKDGSPRYIDYQSGRRGALAYDAASMLFDAKARIPAGARMQLLDHYIDEVSARIRLDRGRFTDEFHDFAAVRVMQALGAFGNLGLKKNRPGFRSAIPPALDNLAWLADNSPVMRRLNHLPVLFRDASQKLLTMEFPEPL